MSISDVTLYIVFVVNIRMGQFCLNNARSLSVLQCHNTRRRRTLGLFSESLRSMLNYFILGTLHKVPYCHVTFQLQISFQNCFFLHRLFSMFSECRHLSWFPYNSIVITKHRIKRTMSIQMKGNVNMFLFGTYLNICC